MNMKRYKNIIIVVILLCITNTITYFIGSHTFITPTCFFNTEKARVEEIKYCNAWIELCHYYLYDNNPNNPYDSIEKHNYWYDVVMESDYYQQIDSLNQRDWEDWYCDWN